MSDSVDRVFVHALATVRRLPRTGSSRPPPAARLRLYGLYKQSMEGDVASLIPRPSLPISSPDPATQNTVHRYAARDLRTREVQAEIEKWDAWDACRGMSKTDAKREYISTLIGTMKEYASGTAESRELVGELEFVWNQIREQTGSEEGNNGGNDGSGRGSERAAAASVGLGASFGSQRVSVGSGEGSASGMRTRQTRLKRTESGLRVLSPVSQRDEDSVIEPVDVEEEDDQLDDEDEDDDQNLNTAPTSPIVLRGRDVVVPPSDAQNLSTWQTNIEEHLHALKTEIAALREQLSANHLLSSSTYSLGGAYYTLSRRQRFLHRAKHYIRTFGTLFFRQTFVQLGILCVVMLWGRIQGDLRVEMKVRDLVARFYKRSKAIFGGVAYWLLDVFGRDGKLSFLGRLLRIS